MPSPSPLSRRTFLTGLGALGAGAILAACGSGDGDDDGDAGDAGAEGGFQPLRVSSDLYASPRPQRFAFAVYQGPTPSAGPPATISFAPDGRSAGAPMQAALHAEGLPKGRGVYVAQAVLPTAGVWDALVEWDGMTAELPFQVAAQTSVPVPGSPAPRAASPTAANPLGTDPLCTLDGGPCPMHAVSLDQVIGAGKPVLVSFSTPARCQTRYCGPTLEQIVEIRPRYQSEVEFVHVEIYLHATGPELVPTVSAWKLQTEPWLFGVDGTGAVVGRLDGAFDDAEITGLLDRLVGS